MNGLIEELEVYPVCLCILKKKNYNFKIKIVYKTLKKEMTTSYLTRVNISNFKDKDTLSYNAATQEFVNATISNITSINHDNTLVEDGSSACSTKVAPL